MTNLTKVNAALASVKKSTPFSVQRYAMGSGSRAYANVLLHVPNAGVNETELASAVARAFDGKLQLALGTAHRPNPKVPTLVLARVEANREIRSYDEEGVKGLTAATANVFRDEADNIWKKVGDGETAVLVRDSEDDIEHILASRQAGSLETASVRVGLHEEASIGQAICWFDNVGSKMRYGVKCGKDHAFDTETATVHAIASDDVFATAPHAAVSEIAAGHKAMFAKDAAPLSPSNMMAKHLAYMSMLYDARTPYFQKLTSLMKAAFGGAALRTG